MGIDLESENPQEDTGFTPRMKKATINFSLADYDSNVSNADLQELSSNSLDLTVMNS